MRESRSWCVYSFVDILKPEEVQVPTIRPIDKTRCPDAGGLTRKVKSRHPEEAEITHGQFSITGGRVVLHPPILRDLCAPDQCQLKLE